MAERQFEVDVNGRRVRLRAHPDEPLLWVLRDRLGLTGSKFGCGTGACGACSVLVNGEARRSCQITLSRVAATDRIVTIEGLARDGDLTPLQRSFVEHTAFGCGYCTPGMVITATALLERNPSPTREEIVAAMDRNLCRCASYVNIIDAIQAVAASGRSQRGR